MVALLFNETTDHTSRPYGRDVANLSFHRAMARYGTGPELSLYTMMDLDPAAVRKHLQLGAARRLEILRHPSHGALEGHGTLHHPAANLYRLAWLREPAGAARFSISGLIHSLGPQAMLEVISRVVTAPVMPWDALICTSEAVRRTATGLLEETIDHLQERVGGTRRPLPNLPVLPLGVDCDALAPSDARRTLGRTLRGRLGIPEDAVVVLWVGRLSFFEKAHPYATYRALELAQQAAGGRLRFVEAGWFPRESDAAHYEALARDVAPSVPVHRLDGRVPADLAAAWAASDIFVSLVDNIQETFGLTPVEAMAAGLPVVASDWDGYRDTIPDGVAGFRIPTVLPPPGSGQAFADGQVLGIVSYQRYVGSLAQCTAIDIGAAAAAIARLANDPALRHRCGEAARRHAVSTYDWSQVMPRYEALWRELDAQRPPAESHPPRPPRGVTLDPLARFVAFPSRSMQPEDLVTLAPDASEEALDRLWKHEIVRFAEGIATVDQCRAALAILRADGPLTLRALAARQPRQTPARTFRVAGWLAKYGLVEIAPAG